MLGLKQWVLQLPLKLAEKYAEEISYIAGMPQPRMPSVVTHQ